MKALSVALAVCAAAVIWPARAHANPIGARTATITCALNAGTVERAKAADEDDVTFTSRTSLDRSVDFASQGTVASFLDDRVSLGNEGLGLALHSEILVGLNLLRDRDRDDQGEQEDADVHVEHAQHAEADEHGEHGEHGAAAHHENEAHGGNTPNLPRGLAPKEPAGGGGVTTSSTPEPASMLLLGTGLLGLYRYRRQLLA